MANVPSGANDALPELPALAKSAEEFLAQQYDYVIVGGGTAGLVVAARLSENPDVTVGVLEAGKCKLNDMLVDTPAFFQQMLGNPEYDWMLKTEPQPGPGNGIHHMPCGKLLGGSSGINYMMYVRGSDQDYDDWATLAGDPSWSAAAMKKYIHKHQTLDDTDGGTFGFAREYHGTSGPIHTSVNDTRLDIEGDWILASKRAAGLPEKSPDPWDGQHIGFFSILGSVARMGEHRGRRSYAARGYFEANAQRPNLKVLCEAQVSNIILEGNTAVGAAFRFGGQEKSVRAKREVILSAGVIHSPQLLELSGIGDPEVLRKAGVEVKVELPSVGNNFQDHVVTGQVYELVAGVKSLDDLHAPASMAAALETLSERRGGPLTDVSTGQGFVSYRSLVGDEELERTLETIRETLKGPQTTEFERKQLEVVMAHLKDSRSANLQIVLVPAAISLGDEGIEDQSKMYPAGDPTKNNRVVWGAALQYPVSRGSVHIQSSDSTDPPIINPAYLTHPADVAVLGTGFRLANRIAATPPLAPKISKRLRPAPDIDLDVQANAERSICEWYIGEYHPCGSCAMGDTVDSKLKVVGVKNLRVVDASIFPGHMSGNIQSAVYAMAEKAADIIKDE
ncbi:putative aryl-alcohol dehydrogenase protein [Botryosphaeria dothidea]|uniref:Aryl-alcohol dehydrogenase protein n=1 Tax=Botryosphaeria dothidea TaxID=55169 RepID=A0A8H4J2Q0_9PEZI|nr:putative aryl-alcohol dehydrogenase protein [Botryosphaeria dothidea]